MSTSTHEFDDLSTVLDEQDEKLKPPRMYQVVMLNDDYTPMDFVVEVLIKFFNMDEAQANKIMLQIHHKGKAICGVFSKDVAETKAVQVVRYAEENQHPLKCTTEEVPE